jgi:cysteine desulfurase/selenocysteine lyase
MTTSDGVGRLGAVEWDSILDEGLVTRLANELFRDGTAVSGIARGDPIPLPVMTRIPTIATAPAAPVALPGEADYYFLRPLRDQVVSRPPRPAGTPDIAGYRGDFPALHQQVHGKPLVWLDNAATTQKPQVVIDTLSRFYEHDNSNVHRGAHALAARSTDAYEGARQRVARFLGAPMAECVVFVRGTTEAINLVAQTYGRQRVGAGDEVIVTTLEHHSNLVPWQMLCQEKGATLRVVPITDRGEIVLEEYERLLGPRVRVVALSHVSNALGTVLPVELMTQMAHRHGACVVVDGAQAVSHFPVDVRAIDCDFYAFSGHKLFAPTGVGVLYGKQTLLEEMPPWQGGGSMIRTVSFDHTTYNDPPYKFEAGTPVIGDAVGLGAAIDYVEGIGREAIARYEQGLTAYATDALSTISGLRQIGTAPGKVAVLSFVVDWMPAEDLGAFLDREGVAVRAGHHCAQPTMHRYGVTSTVRPSLALYNTPADIDTLVEAIRKSRNGGARN